MSLKKIDTPVQSLLPNLPYPKDPASIAGIRDNPLYIGPTNWGSLQNKYTPYQLNRATRRDAQGNIFWQKGTDIAKIPAAPAAQSFVPPTLNTMSTDYIPSGSTVPITNTNKITTTDGSSLPSAFANAQSKTAATYLTGIQSSIDGLLAQREALQTKGANQAQQQVSDITKNIGNIATETPYTTNLDNIRERFHVDQSIQTLQTIQAKIVSASAALNQGILYEENKPIRMQLIVGRANTLQRQGIASIGAMKAAAEIVQGNITQAKGYAADTADALKADSVQQQHALDTLLSLAHDNLTTLSKGEKKTVDDRLQLLKDRSNHIDKNTNDVMNLAAKYPHAFVKGDVSFIDSPQEALSKMLPQMSAEEQQTYNIDMARKEVALRNANAVFAKRTGRGESFSPLGQNSSSDGGAQTPAQSTALISQYIMYLKSQNPDITPEEIRYQVYANATQFRGLSVSKINSIVDREVKPPSSTKVVTSKTLQDVYSLDPAQHPQLVGKTYKQVSAWVKKNPLPKKKGFWGGVFSFLGDNLRHSMLWGGHSDGAGQSSTKNSSF